MQKYDINGMLANETFRNEEWEVEANAGKHDWVMVIVLFVALVEFAVLLPLII